MKRWFAVLLLAALCGGGVVWAATLPYTQQGTVGGGGYEGDTLDTNADVDTIGPVNVGACAQVSLYAQWSGDSCSVSVERSVDFVNWFAVSSLASAYAGQDDSAAIWYAKIIKAAPDTGSVQVFDHTFGPWLRMRLTNMTAVPDSAAADSNAVTGVKGGILCVD
jgi:hypothetical protein